MSLQQVTYRAFCICMQVKKLLLSQLAESISRDYRGRDLHLVGVLKGAFQFTRDLSRALTVPHSVDYTDDSYCFGMGHGTAAEANCKDALWVPGHLNIYPANPGDKAKLAAWFTSVREREQRLEADEAWIKKPKPKVKRRESKSNRVSRSPLLDTFAMYLNPELNDQRLLLLKLMSRPTFAPRPKPTCDSTMTPGPTPTLL